LTATNGNITFNPTSGSNVIVNSTLNMSNNSIINCSQLNGHNLYSYGRFYSTASQTLGAAITPTRIKMDATGVSAGITLDSSTNIGRLSFTQTGTYSISWNAHLVHGLGGSARTDIWMRLSGTDAAYSTKTTYNDTGLNESVLGDTQVLTITSSQYLEFWWAADATNVPITFVAASTSPYNKPATAGFNCVINIVA
jgi:hypothetical protein